jgi:ATP-dependent Clp protease ATP-binding subunit ClpA
MATRIKLLGMFEERIKNVILRFGHDKKNKILFIDEMHKILNVNNISMGATNLL